MDESQTCSTEESTWMIKPLTGSPSNSNIGSLIASRPACLKGAVSMNGLHVSALRLFAMNGVMEALTDANAFINGVYGTQTAMADLVERVTRRAQKDSLFDMVIRISVAKKSDMKKINLLFDKICRVMRVARRKKPADLKRIQGELANALGFTMEDESETGRASLLRDRIKTLQKILVVLQDLNQGLDLQRLGIPFGADHTGCKILLTSTNQEILSNQMHAHRVFKFT